MQVYKHKEISSKQRNIFWSRVFRCFVFELSLIVTSPSLSTLISLHKHGESYGWQLHPLRTGDLEVTNPTTLCRHT